MYNAAKSRADDYGPHPRRSPAIVTVKGALAPRHRGHGPPEEAQLSFRIKSTGTPEAQDALTLTAITAASNGADTDAASNAHRVLQRRHAPVRPRAAHPKYEVQPRRRLRRAGPRDPEVPQGTEAAADARGASY